MVAGYADGVMGGKLFELLFFAAVAAFIVGCEGPLAEDCAHGDLDQRYCDGNGDLVADPTGDPRMRLDPERLIFAYTPVEDPAQFRDVWAGFLAHLEKAVSRDVLFFPVQSNAAQIEAMRAGRLHVAGFNTGSVPLAVNCAGFVPTTMMAREDGSFGYEMEILTHRESGIESVEELRGRTLAFTSPTSNSGLRLRRSSSRRSLGWWRARTSSRRSREDTTIRCSASSNGTMTPRRSRTS